ncbi:hypothetical protein MKX01_026527 [Papaver californicum]|nr:hypothetical protein MKX01_026527 [Papaver californicum]
MSSAKLTKTTLPGIHQDQHSSMITSSHKRDDDVVEISSIPSSSRLTTAPTSITHSTNKRKNLSSQENQTPYDHQGDDSLLREWEKFVEYGVLSKFDEWADYATEDYEHLIWTTTHNMFSDVEEVTLF